MTTIEIRKHRKVWPSYLEDGPSDLDELIPPRCWDDWQHPSFHLDRGGVIPIRLADGTDAFGVVGKWCQGKGAVLVGTFSDEAAAEARGCEERRRAYEEELCDIFIGGRLPDDAPLWKWNATIDAWVSE